MMKPLMNFRYGEVKPLITTVTFSFSRESWIFVPEGELLDPIHLRNSHYSALQADQPMRKHNGNAFPRNLLVNWRSSLSKTNLCAMRIFANANY
jgi:hypothetical protein